MTTYWPIEHALCGFSVAFGAALALAYWMERISLSLWTFDRTLRRFTIVDLEFPNNPQSIPRLLRGIAKLPPEGPRPQQVWLALKRILWIDYLFMPAIYGAIFLLCMQVAGQFEAGSAGRNIMAALAWLQVLALLLDSIENGILLARLKSPDLPMSLALHRFYTVVVYAKWAIALIGGVSALMLALYFFLKGRYAADSWVYPLIFMAQILLFAWGMRQLAAHKVSPHPKP